MTLKDFQQAAIDQARADLNGGRISDRRSKGHIGELLSVIDALQRGDLEEVLADEAEEEATEANTDPAADEIPLNPDGTPPGVGSAE